MTTLVEQRCQLMFVKHRLAGNLALVQDNFELTGEVLGSLSL